MSDASSMLQRLIALIKNLKVPSDVLTNSQSARDFQTALNPIESNADPENPGLEEVFELANEAIKFQTDQINETKFPPASQIANLAVPLYDAWASWQMEQYLLRISNSLGFPGPAQKFLISEQVINERVNPLPYLITPPPPTPVPPPGPPGPTPTPTPTPGPSPSPAPGPTPTPTPTPTPSVVEFVAAEQNLFPGSGEPTIAPQVKTALNVNAVYVPVLAFTTSGTSTDANWRDSDNNPTLVGGTIDQVVQTYIANGLDVILALVIDCADGTKRYNFHPTNTVAFLTHLQALAVQLALAATRNKASGVSIAPGVFPYSNNGDTPAQYMPQWRALYAACKSAFTGPVLYQATPATVGPKGSATAMDWGSDTTFIWDAIGVEIAAPISNNTDSVTIKNFWETSIDLESPYGLPLWGPSGWVRKLFTDWSFTGRKIWLTTTGITGSGAVPSPIPVSPVPAPPGPTPSPGPAPAPTPTPTPTPSPSPGPAPVNPLTAGYMHTSGSQILDVNNTPVRICAVTWNGQHIRNGFPRGLDIVSYRTTMNDMARLGFNTIRLTLNDASVMNNDAISGINYAINTDLVGLGYLEVLDAIIGYAGQIGMRIILDSHTCEGVLTSTEATGQANGLWFDSGNGTDGSDGSGVTGTITSDLFLQHWTRLASRYRGNTAIVGYDIRWCPVATQGTASGVTWGDNSPTDLDVMYTNVGNAIQTIDSGPLIICEAPVNFTAGAFEGDLRPIVNSPVTLNTLHKVVYAVQSFPNEVANMGLLLDSGITYVSRANTMFGFMVSNNIAPVMVIACGDAMLTQDATGWATTFVQYINGAASNGPRFTGTQQGLSWAWCYWGVHQGTTPDFGVATAWGGGSLYAEQSAYLVQMRPLSSTPVPVPTPTPTPTPTPPPTVTPSANGTTVPPASKIIGSDLSVWSISNSQVMVNGQLDNTTSNVIELAYVNGVVWRKATATILSTSTYITPGNGTISFNGTWRLDASGNVLFNGSLVPGGSGTEAVDLYQGVIYGQDFATGNWFTWDGTNWNPASAPGNLPQGVLWWSKSIPTDQWSPSSGTTVDPLSVLAPTPTPVPTGPSVTFNLQSSTGNIIRPQFYGVASASARFGPPDNYVTMTDPAFQTLCKSLNIGSLRLNWLQNTHMDEIFPTRTSAPDWSFVDNFIHNASKCFNVGTTLSTANIIITIGYNSWLDVTSASDWAIHQDRVQQVAQHFVNGGLPVFYWEFANEADSLDLNAAIGLFKAMNNGVKTVNSQFQAGGLGDSWANSQRLIPFIQQCAPDFVGFHGYTEENGSKSVAQCFADELTDTAADVKAYMTSNGMSPSAPMIQTEFNMDGIPGASSYQADITGAVYAAFRYAVCANAGTFWSMHRWDLVFDQWYGLIDSPNGAAPYNLRPAAYVYQKLGALAPGTVVSSTVSSGMNLVALGSLNGTSACCQIINYDVSQSYPVSVVINGTTNTAWSYWELSAAHPSGFTTSFSTTALGAGISIPAMSVVVITGAASSSPPPPSGSAPTAPSGLSTSLVTPASVTLSWSASTEPGVPTPTPSPPSTQTNFTISNGNIISPAGRTWTAQGVNILDSDIPNVTLADVANLFANKINCIRLACGGDNAGFLSAQSNSTIQTFVNMMTNNGQGPIAVVIENHDPTQQAAYTGSTLAAEQAWYRALAVIFKNNGFVFFASMNEPGPGAVSAQHLATYNTIRSVSNTLVGLCIVAGDDFPDNPSVYSSMHGVFFDIHFYNWMTFSGSSTCPAASSPTNQTSVNNALTSYIQNINSFASSADGPMIALILECGFIDYAHDPNAEVNGSNGTNQVVIAALTIGQSIGRGTCIWLWAGLFTFGNSVTDLVNESNKTLTQHGSVVLAHMT